MRTTKIWEWQEKIAYGRTIRCGREIWQVPGISGKSGYSIGIIDVEVAGKYGKWQDYMVSGRKIWLMAGYYGKWQEKKRIQIKFVKWQENMVSCRIIW